MSNVRKPSSCAGAGAGDSASPPPSPPEEVEGLTTNFEVLGRGSSPLPSDYFKVDDFWLFVLFLFLE